MCATANKNIQVQVPKISSNVSVKFEKPKKPKKYLNLKPRNKAQNQIPPSTPAPNMKKHITP